METPANPSTVTDALLASGGWVVGERYVVREGIDRFPRDLSWLPVEGQPEWPVQLRDGRLVWPERDRSGHWVEIPDADRGLRQNETRVHVVVDESPVPRTRTPRVWLPAERKGLADELAGLATKDDAAIVHWVEVNGFVGVRANPRERQESIEEIRWALQRLALARDLLRATRERRGDDLRVEAERLLSLPDGLLSELTRDHTETWDDEEGHHEVVVKAENQPWGGARLARTFGISVPPGQHCRAQVRISRRCTS